MLKFPYFNLIQEITMIQGKTSMRKGVKRIASKKVKKTKKDNDGTRIVYSYGAREIKKNKGLEIFWDETQKMNDLYNAIVELFNLTQEKKQRIDKKIPGFVKAEKTKEWDKLKELRKMPKVVDGYKRADEQHNKGIAQLKKYKNVHWANFNFIYGRPDSSSNRAMEMAKENNSVGARLKYKKFHQKKRYVITNQMNEGPVPWGDVLRGEGKFRGYTNVTVDVSAKRGKVVLRTGPSDLSSQDHIEPVECEFIYHRPIPEDAMLQYIRIVCERRGPMNLNEKSHTSGKWYVQFGLSRKKGWKKNKKDKLILKQWNKSTGKQDKTVYDLRLNRDRSVAVYFDPRLMKNGYRVGCFYDGHGNVQDISLPPKYFHNLKYCDKLKEITDKERNKIKEFLHQCKNKFPKRLRDQLKNVHSWKASGKIVGFLGDWKNNRFSGDANMFVQVERWRVKQDKHLREWQMGVRARAERYRDNHYRILAGILSHYKEIVVDDINFADKQASEARKTGVPKHVVSWGKRNAADAAPGILREYILKYDNAKKLAVEDSCYKCGNKVQQIKNTTMVECNSCGTVDRAENACKNLYYQAVGQ